MTGPRLPTHWDDSFELESGEASHARAPDTFWIPDLQVRESVAPGQIVKLVFRIYLEGDEVSVERMWVKVTDRVGRYYSGVLDNDPECTEELRSGHQLSFLPEHIINIWED